MVVGSNPMVAATTVTKAGCLSWGTFSAQVPTGTMPTVLFLLEV